MATEKISALGTIGAGSITGDDVTVIVDMGGAPVTTYKCTLAELRTALLPGTASGFATTDRSVAAGFRTKRVTGLTLTNTVATTVLDLSTVMPNSGDTALVTVFQANTGGRVVSGHVVCTDDSSGYRVTTFEQGVAGWLATFSVSGVNLKVTQSVGADTPVILIIFIMPGAA